MGIRQAFQLPNSATLLPRCCWLVEYFKQSAVAMFMLYEKQKQQSTGRCMLVSNHVAW